MLILVPHHLADIILHLILLPKVPTIPMAIPKALLKLVISGPSLVCYTATAVVVA